MSKLSPQVEQSGMSVTQGKSTIERWLLELRPSCAVDVGAGMGVYGEMLRRVLPQSRRVAVEAFWPNVPRYRLNRLYQHVVVADARWLDWARVVNTYSPDVVICGDVLEHMTRADAIDMVDRITWLNLPVLASVPVIPWPQDDIDGNPFERHEYHWKHEEFLGVFNVLRNVVDPPVGVYWVTGRAR